MEDEGDREADDECAEYDEDARPQLVEVLDERRLFTVAEAPWQAHHVLDGVALALARSSRRVGRLHRQLGRLVVVGPCR